MNPDLAYVELDLSAVPTSRCIIENPEVMFPSIARAIAVSLSHVPLNQHPLTAFLLSHHCPHEALAAILTAPLPVRTPHNTNTQHWF